MQAYDLNSQLLDSISKAQFMIVTANLSPQVVAQYSEWHQGLEPSYKYLRHLLAEYLTANQFKMLRSGAQTLIPFFARIATFKIPRIFLRAYLSIIQEHIKVLEDLIKIEDLVRSWKTISIDILEQYLNAFGIVLEGGKNDGKPLFVIPSSEYEQIKQDLSKG